MVVYCVYERECCNMDCDFLHEIFHKEEDAEKWVEDRNSYPDGCEKDYFIEEWEVK